MSKKTQTGLFMWICIGLLAWCLGMRYRTELIRPIDCFMIIPSVVLGPIALFIVLAQDLPEIKNPFYQSK